VNGELLNAWSISATKPPPTSLMLPVSTIPTNVNPLYGSQQSVSWRSSKPNGRWAIIAREADEEADQKAAQEACAELLPNRLPHPTKVVDGFRFLRDPTDKEAVNEL
jgi:hypothetical protein